MIGAPGLGRNILSRRPEGRRRRRVRRRPRDRHPGDHPRPADLRRRRVAGPARPDRGRPDRSAAGWAGRARRLRPRSRAARPGRRSTRRASRRDIAVLVPRRRQRVGRRGSRTRSRACTIGHQERARPTLVLNPLETVLTSSPWWLVVVGRHGPRAGPCRAAGPSIIAGDLPRAIVLLGLWEHSMATLANVLVATALTLVDRDRDRDPDRPQRPPPDHPATAPRRGPDACPPSST